MSKKIILGFIIVSGLIMIGREGFGEPFLIRGTRPLAMGGAFVAVAEDATASYWNPAGLAKQQKRFDVEIPFYIDVTGTGDIVKEIDGIAKCGYEAIKKEAEKREYGGSSIDAKYVKDFFRLLDGLDNLNKEDLGIIINAGGGLNLRVRNWGFSVVGYTMACGDPFIDLNNITLGRTSGTSTVNDARDTIKSLVGDGNDIYATGTSESNLATTLTQTNIGTEWIITQNQAEQLIKYALEAGLSYEEMEKYTKLITEIASKIKLPTAGSSTGSALEDNKSTLVAKGCLMQEFMVTHARAFPQIREKFYLGANLKYMRATMGWYDPQVFEENVDEKIKDVIKDKYTKSSSAFGIDLGALYDVNKKLTTGVVIKNINSPAFDYPDKANLPKYKIKPQIRAGVCYKPWRGMTLAADLDMTKNKTILDGFDSKLLSAGFEWWWFNFIALRAGLLKNLAESSVGVVYTGGLGVNLLHLHIDLTGMISSKRTQIEGGDKVPTNLGGAMQVSLNF